MTRYDYILKYMTQQELIDQCLLLVNARDENIHYYEYKAMYEAIKLPDNKYGIRDVTSGLYIKLKPVRDKLDVLRKIYD